MTETSLRIKCTNLGATYRDAFVAARSTATVEPALVPLAQAVGTSAFAAAAAGTGDYPLSDVDRRAVLTSMVDEMEEEIFGISHQISNKAAVVASLRIGGYRTVVVTGDIDQAAAAAAEVCMIAFAVFSAAPIFQGPERLSARAVQSFRAHAGVKLLDAARTIATAC